jgi:phage terminase large subunit-like protein
MNYERALEIAKELEFRKLHNALKYYTPYAYQKEFHEAEAAQKLLMAGNRIGKSYCGAMEMAYHLTGLYPKWWKGRKWDRPVRAWVGGASNETTRDICQKELLGQPDDSSVRGTGAIPLDCIGEATRKPGVPNAHNAVMIKHISGGYSRLGFKAYEMGKEKWMGETLDVIWLDEEPPPDIYSQAVTRTADRGGMVYMTFTPENGMTQTVAQFMNDLRNGQFMMQAGWDDAPHMTTKVKEQILSALPPHERKMREMGIPSLGSGLVFPVPEDIIKCEPFEIPAHWPRICGMDYGWDHPTTAAWIAWDRDSDVAYVYDTYSQRQEIPAVHAAAVNARPKWIPVIWPRDGRQADKGSGTPLADQYRTLGVNMLKGGGRTWGGWFTNPPSDGQREGSGGVSLEAGIMDMLERMKTGRFKIFDNQKEIFAEFRMYHRKEGRIVPFKDDLISAARYAVMSLRHARVHEIQPRQYKTESEFNVFG